MYKQNNIYIYICILYTCFFILKRPTSSALPRFIAIAVVDLRFTGRSEGAATEKKARTQQKHIQMLTCILHVYIFTYIYTLPETNSEFTHENSNLCWKMINFQIRDRPFFHGFLLVSGSVA